MSFLVMCKLLNYSEHLQIFVLFECVLPLSQEPFSGYKYLKFKAERQGKHVKLIKKYHTIQCLFVFKFYLRMLAIAKTLEHSR